MIDREISLSIQDLTGEAREFKSLRSFTEFCQREADYWSKQQAEATSDRGRKSLYLAVHHSFTDAVATILSWTDKLEQWNDNQFQQQFQNIKSNYLNQLTNFWISSESPLAEKIVQCVENGGDRVADAFIKYVVRKEPPNIGNIESFRGALLGYEYENQESDIVRRRKGEEISLERLRSRLAETTETLFNEVAQLKQEHIDWDTESRSASDRLLSVQKKLGERQRKHQSEYFDMNFQAWNVRLTELEKTYEEKLKLKKPAEYWAKAAKKYGIQGGLWTLAIVSLVVVGLLYFREFFTAWLTGQQLAIELKSLQGVVLYSSIIAIYAYLIRVFSRLAFSAFHLMRDAEEREQLTYLYLSLSNESVIDERSREIVLQALFCRSETGLLANEHGPTMPGMDLLKSSFKK